MKYLTSGNEKDVNDLYYSSQEKIIIENILFNKLLANKNKKDVFNNNITLESPSNRTIDILKNTKSLILPNDEIGFFHLNLESNSSNNVKLNKIIIPVNLYHLLFIQKGCNSLSSRFRLQQPETP